MMLAALLIAVLAHQASAQPAQPTTVRVCVGNGKTTEAPQCTAWLNKALPAGQTVPSFQCVYEASADACLQRVVAGNAEFVRGGGELIFQGGRQHGLVVYASEEYGADLGSNYFGVAIVKKAFCDARRNDVTMRDLKGTRSCHTGYRRTAGWTLPVGYLVSRSIMPVISEDGSVQDDAESVASFFEDVCAPGTTNGVGNAAGPRTDGSSTGQPWGAMCSICNKGKQTCTATSAYSDYGGALRCMVEDSGEVAFVKHSTPTDFSIGGKSAQPWSINSADLRIVCADNSGCQPVTEWNKCGYARAPSHAFVGASGNILLEDAARLFVNASSVPGWITEGIALGVLTADATAIRTHRPSGRPVSAQDLMGPNTFDSFEAVRQLREPAKSSSGGDSGLKPGAIAGIVVGAVVGTALLASVIGLVVVRYNKKKSWEEFCRQHDSSAGVTMTGAKTVNKV